MYTTNPYSFGLKQFTITAYRLVDDNRQLSLTLSSDGSNPVTCWVPVEVITEHYGSNHAVIIGKNINMETTQTRELHFA